jgi:hypothetical protein
MTVREALLKKYPPGECVLLSEVSDTTGGRNNSCDFMVVNMWPSRGNSIIGFELKSYRSDWLRELKHPQKQETIFKYCDYFYLLTDKDNIAKIDEIPHSWGWIHFDGKRLNKMKDAPKLNPVQVSRGFMCSMLRRASDKEGWIHKNELTDEIEKQSEIKKSDALREINVRLLKLEQIAKDTREFENATGITVSNPVSWRNSPQETAKAIACLKMWQPGIKRKEIEDLLQRWDKISENLKHQISCIPLIDSVSENFKNI